MYVMSSVPTVFGNIMVLTGILPCVELHYYTIVTVMLCC